MKRVIGTALLLASGIAWACTYSPIPPFQAAASWIDLGIAWVQGYENAPHAATMKEVDRLGRMSFGSDWKKRGFKGHITYSTPMGGSHIQYVEKDCDEEMIDKSEKDEEAGYAAAGGSPDGAVRWYGGAVYGSGGATCIYGCSGTVRVGDPLPDEEEA